MPKGSIVHIDNLYVKPQAVKSDTLIDTGDLCIFETDGLRPIVAGDFSGNDTFLDIESKPIFQAGHRADNRTATLAKDKVNQVSVLTVGGDWVYPMAAGVEPSKRVGIHRLDARTPIIAISDVEDTLVTPSAPTLAQTLGQYKHKEFAKLASDSVLNDDGVISTGVL